MSKIKTHLDRKEVLKIISQNLATEKEVLFKKILEKYPNADRKDILQSLNRTRSKGFIVLNENGSYSVSEEGKKIYLPGTN